MRVPSYVVRRPNPAGYAVAAGKATSYGAVSPDAVTQWVDANGSTALHDPSGHIIHGTVRDIEGSPVADSFFQASGAHIVPIIQADVPSDTAAAASPNLATQITAWARTPTGMLVVGGALALSLGAIAYTLLKPMPTKKMKTARANPSRRHRRRRAR